MNRIIKLLESASDVDLEMSRFDCHVKGLHSIVLRNTNGILTRCFLADSNHNMYRNLNFDDMLLNLGVHSHRYDINITGVSGSAINMIFCESDTGVEVSKYKFKNADDSDYIGESFLELKKLQAVQKDDSIYMLSNELHTMYVPKGQKASWIVQEFKTISDYTYLYTNNSPLGEKYLTKPSGYVRSFVRQFFSK